MLTIKSLNAGYGRNAVLQDINLEIQPGEVLALIGPNGAGKSSLMRTIATLQHQDEGTVTFNGINAAESPEKIREVLEK